MIDRQTNINSLILYQIQYFIWFIYFFCLFLHLVGFDIENHNNHFKHSIALNV